MKWSRNLEFRIEKKIKRKGQAILPLVTAIRMRVEIGAPVISETRLSRAQLIAVYRKAVQVLSGLNSLIDFARSAIFAKILLEDHPTLIDDERLMPVSSYFAGYAIKAKPPVVFPLTTYGFAPPLALGP